MRMSFTEIPIAMGTGCKVDCPICPVHDVQVPAYVKLGGAKLMTPTLLEKYLRTVPRDSILTWSGFSEPFLNPHMADIIRHYPNDGWKMRLDTTLVGCSKEGAELIASVPWLFLKLHLPSHGDNMKLAVTPEYLEKLAIAISGPCPKSLVYFGIMRADVKEVLSRCMGRIEYHTHVHSRAGNLASKPKMERRTGVLTKECLWFRRGHIMPNGKLCLCCEDWALMHVIGDLNTETYQEIFEKPEFLELLSRHQDDSKPLLCRTCEYPNYAS